MRNCGGCGTWIPDDAAFCPSCGRGQGGAAAAPPPPDPRPGPDPAPPPDPGAPGPDPEAEALAAAVRDRAASRVRTLGVLYMVYGALQVGMVAWSAYAQWAGDGQRAIEDVRRQFPQFEEAFDQWAPLLSDPWYLMAVHFLPFLLGVAAFASGVQLRALRGRNLGMAVAVGLIALFCVENCCCLLGIPLGIGGLVVLASGEAAVVMDRPGR